MTTSSRGLLSHLIHVDRVAQTRDKSRAAEQQQRQNQSQESGTAVVNDAPALSSEASTLPAHIIAVTEVRKLNVQVPYFRCPAWADLPPRAYHLHCTREGVTLPPLALHRFAFYLFGKSAVCDYVLEHPSVSAVHAVLVYHRQQECFVLVDLGSTNGVRLNKQRIAPRKPVPAPVGSVIQFGYSTRLYEIRTGVPTSSKREREELAPAASVLADGPSKSETAKSQVLTHEPCRRASTAVPQTAASRPMDNDTDAPQPTSSAMGRATSLTHVAQMPVSSISSSSGSNINHDNNSDSTGVDAKTTAVKTRTEDMQIRVTHSSPTIRRAHLYQLVVKHKDVDNPVSRGQRKGDLITRSREDALDIVQSIVRAHELQYRARTASVPLDVCATRQERAAASAPLVPWTVEEFIAMVLQYCEVSNPKKRGDLGVVEEGTFTEDFDRAAFALRRGEVSEPVETPLGIHLIYRCD